MISFIIPGSPVPQGRPRFVNRGKFVTTYDPPKSKAAKKVVSEVATMAAFDAGITEPLEGPLYIDIVFSMPIPKSSKAKTGDRHIKRPDIDNLIKLVLDGIGDSRAVWRDDSQVVSINAHKMYSEKPQTWVNIARLSE